MDYSQTIDFLFAQTPQFQQIGAAAYKPGLDSVRRLAAEFGNPEKRLRCIHVAGTNGKGSTSHSIASVLQAAGYKVGLFTSPHLIDFRERIKINGQMIPQGRVVEFVDKCRREGLFDSVKPSFFELTTVMAFKWFADSDVDYAVIEVGLGGRLDSTNIITPLLSVITNISLDHTAQLGDTLGKIATEKAGIIKYGVPVVIGEGGEVREIFSAKAAAEDAPICFAEDFLPGFEEKCTVTSDGVQCAETPFGQVHLDLAGDYQLKNLRTVITVLCRLQRSVEFSDDDVRHGLSQVVKSTGLLGRWMRLNDSPLTICDTGHNIGGWQYLGPRLSAFGAHLIVIIGFVNDKDISHILPLMPKEAHFIFTRASVPRALSARKLAETASTFGLMGEVIEEGVGAAISRAHEIADGIADPVIFIGGSTFVVADALSV